MVSNWSTNKAFEEEGRSFENVRHIFDEFHLDGECKSDWEKKKKKEEELKKKKTIERKI